MADSRLSHSASDRAVAREVTAERSDGSPNLAHTPSERADDEAQAVNSLPATDTKVSTEPDQDIEMRRGGGESANKRGVAAQRNDRKASKDERRQQRPDDQSPSPFDQAEIMNRYHHLNELRSSRAISDDDFERQRHDIFVLLGLEQP